MAFSVTFLSVGVLMNYPCGRDSRRALISVPNWERREQQTKTISPEEEGSGRAVPRLHFLPAIGAELWVVLDLHVLSHHAPLPFLLFGSLSCLLL